MPSNSIECPNRRRRTNAHKNQETRAELSEIHNGIAAALDEIIRIGASAADPVRQRGEDISSDDEKREILLKEGAGEDNEEEADGEDLCA